MLILPNQMVYVSIQHLCEIAFVVLTETMVDRVGGIGRKDSNNFGSTVSSWSPEVNWSIKERTEKFLQWKDCDRNPVPWPTRRRSALKICMICCWLKKCNCTRWLLLFFYYFFHATLREGISCNGARRKITIKRRIGNRTSFPTDNFVGASMNWWN